MKPLLPVLGLAWLLTLGAAFLVGQKSPAGRNADGQDHDGAASSSRLASSASKSRRGDSLPARESRSGLRSVIGGEAGRILAGTPPRQAVVELAQLTDPVERARGFLALIEALEPGEFRDVVADFRALGITEQRMSEYGMLLHAWGKADPLAAIDYAREHTGTPFAQQTVLASWAADDPHAAVAYARENHEGDGPNPFLVGVIRGVAPSDLNLATQLLQDLPYSRERGDALQGMLPFVMENGADVALNWTNGIADERLKTGAVTFILNDLSQSQPEVAAEVLVGLEDNNAAVRVAGNVAGSLARSNLEQAITWSAGLEPDLRAQAVEGIVGPYASQDPQAASAWLASLDGTTNLDAAIRSFAWTAQRREPQLAADWIGRIANERQRQEMYRNVLGRWWNSDQAAAEQWIQSNPALPDDLRTLPARLQEQRERREVRREQ